MKIFCLLGILFFSLQSFATEDPQACLKKAVFPCAVASEKPIWVKAKNLQIYLGKDSAVLLKSKQEWQLLKGQAWLESGTGWVLTQLGRHYVANGQVWFEKSPERLDARVFTGEIRVQGGVASAMPAGFTNWWTLATEGIIRPFDADATLTAWNRWLRRPKVEAKEQIAEYREIWRDQIEQSSALYQAVVQRRIASVEEREDEAWARSQRQKQDRKHIRELFRSRFESR